MQALIVSENGKPVSIAVLSCIPVGGFVVGGGLGHLPFSEYRKSLLRKAGTEASTSI